MNGVFVTGTGTEVGKTVVAGVLARNARQQGLDVSVFKPAVSGLCEGGPADHEQLRRAAGSSQTDDEIAPYRFQPAVSPHLAAEMAGEPIDIARLRQGLAAARAAARFLVCEGVGGFLVPLLPDYLIRDFARDCGLPVVVVATPGLGTINHALLTIESVRAAGLEVSAVVLTPWPGRPGALELSNRETIERLGEVEVRTLDPIDLAEPDSWPPLSL
ncbi:MAG TPA: dethiobiotin synthase [Solirubrobacterales bacterium]|nr:dethiobiotin synthase [Solirubrobacterales bacterium]